MARKKSRRPTDRAYQTLKDRLTRADPAEADELYARAWAIIAYLRARFILRQAGRDPEDPSEEDKS